MSRSNTDTLRCSFCRKSQDEVGKLISSPSDYARAYICDECIQEHTPEEMQHPPARPATLPNRPSHCLMCHPNAPQLLAAIERWGLAERADRESVAELAEVRRIALAMLGLNSGEIAIHDDRDLTN